jgi:WD40 repeat protein
LFWKTLSLLLFFGRTPDGEIYVELTQRTRFQTDTAKANMKTLRLMLLSATAIAVSLFTAQTQNFSSVVVATNQVPDKVATSLMPVPIYNFAIHNVAFSPDSRFLATGDGFGKVRLWNTQSGNLEKLIPAHANWAFSIAWSKDGGLLVTGGGDDFVRVFAGLNPDKPLKTLAGHGGDVHAVAISPDSRRIYSAGDDKQIMVWNSESGARERAWVAHAKQVPALALSPDGKLLASGSRDNSIRFWNADTGELADTLIGHSEDVMSVRFSPTGTLLASASYDKTVRLWEVKTGKAVHIFKGHTNRVFSVAFSPDGNHLASAGDSTVRIWNVSGKQLEKTISMGGVILTSSGTIPEVLSSVAYSPDGQWLAVSSTSGTTFLLSPESGQVIRKFVDADEPGKP